MSKEWWTHLGKDWWLRASLGAPLVDVEGPLKGHKLYGFQFNRGRFFEIGEFRIAILSLLSEGPKHGYQLMKEMKERSGGTYRASPGSVYPTAQQLEDEGLIASKMEDGRRVYTLTAAGRKELEKDPETAKRIWERAETWEESSKYFEPEVIEFLPAVTEVQIKSLRAARWAAGKPERQIKLKSILWRTIQDLEKLTKK
ncbi:MAG TPA: PadR family transcriptional regulator [Candidatus Angelobacter sp.]|nr:PadR family transcriptional regulator [Candidatus Angelobacter sp.]